MRDARSKASEEFPLPRLDDPPLVCLAGVDFAVDVVLFATDADDAAEDVVAHAVVLVAER